MRLFFDDRYFFDALSSSDERTRPLILAAEVDMLRHGGLGLRVSAADEKQHAESIKKIPDKLMSRTDGEKPFRDYVDTLDELWLTSPNKHVAAFIWSAYKYETLGKSERLYRDIRKYLRDGGLTSGDAFTTVIDDIKRRPFERGQSVNMFTHVYGHFKKQLSGDEKKDVLALLEAYEKKQAMFADVLDRLKSFQRRYVDGYLHRTTLFRSQANSSISM